VEIAFAKKSLRQLCESERTARRSLGARVSEKLKARLADFQAANFVTDIIAGRPREFVGDRTGQVAVDLVDGFQLVFCSNHSDIPLINRTQVDWSRVSRIKIMDIESDND
jgi:hypothetical protein